jgi:hypothetical protein
VSDRRRTPSRTDRPRIPTPYDRMPPSIPLDWTRVSRKRPNSGSPDSACCVDGSCRHRSSPGVRQQEGEAPDAGPAKQVYRGQVVMCLHDANPDWFQGYFFVENGETWGLLGIQKEVDDCLQCSEGGYRQIDLKVKSQDHTFVDVDWTGGDMMDLKGQDVSMQAEKILTGESAVPIVEGVFSGLMRRLRAQDDCEDMDVLQVFPDLAIVVGTMELKVSSSDDT